MFRGVSFPLFFGHILAQRSRPLFSIPTNDGGHVRLLTGSVSVWRRLRKKLAIHHGGEADALAVLRCIQNLICRKSAQLNERLCSGTVSPSLIALAPLCKATHRNGAVE